MPPRPMLGFRPTIGEALRRAADRWGERDFVVLPAERMTYQEAERSSALLARRMLAAGIGKGTRVGLFYTYSTEFVVTWLAALRVGALVMPFSSIYQPAELTTVLRLGDVHTLITHPTMLDKDYLPFLEQAVPGLAHAGEPQLLLEELPYLRQVWLTGPAERAWATHVPLVADDASAPASEQMLLAVEAEVTPADWAQVTYTSGSSALPKGVVHTHGAILRQTSPEAMRAAGREALAQENMAILCAFPFFWIGGTLVLGMALQTGATVCVVPRFEPEAATRLCAREGCATVMAWPSLVQSMRAHPAFSEYDFSGVPSLADPSTVAVADSPREGVPWHRGMSETVGVWNGVQLRCVDPESGADVADLADGELWIRGWGVMQGYYKQEREDVFDSDGWLHTGDRTFLYASQPYFVGRYYEMIKSRGANVSPREVEIALEAHPEIAHALVFGLPHPEFEEEVTAVVVAVPGKVVTPEAVRGWARSTLSSFKVPSRVEIWPDEAAIPWLASGKPDKLRLRALLTDPAN